MSDIRERLATAREERWGILADLAFAVVWVTMVEVLFTFVDGPTWAYYACMFAGVVAYFGFVWNFELATSRQRSSR
ncbi:hypothetical protein CHINAEXTREME_18700 [Halobiforma lacisalsi AJ5]|uniref:DUF8119 domain-containing protein n=2 Tax=Natronobacterium TaxID=2256 RepID=M0LT32_NATLA|nr:MULTISPECIES: hypothetical protein [Halobiforma]APW99674.1 hypothetical protein CHINAEXTREME_18700 [Halobiforma lacisalsi AJ5]EMA35534.1 hypothetical protein C445_04858 [Halobiforma lacisalsi AJ5]SFC10339.1 hypothetical protein SAMN05444422_104281 [Halobiforma haloterrestris]